MISDVVLDSKQFLSDSFVHRTEMSVCSYDSLKDFAVCTSKLSGNSNESVLGKFFKNLKILRKLLTDIRRMATD